MSNPVQAFAALPAQIRHAANETSNVVSLTPNKRPRGRPRKPPLVDRRCTDAFETIAVAVVGLAGQKMLWNALKERVRDKADRDNKLSPASRRVLGFSISRMNRNFGYDWHTGERIAAELGISLGSVNRAFGELARAGYIVRKWIAAPGSHASKLWRTAVPALVVAGHEIVTERENRDRAKRGVAPPTETLKQGSEDGEGLLTKTSEGYPEKGEGPLGKIGKGLLKNEHQTLVREYKNQSARQRDDSTDLPDEGDSLVSASPAAPEGAASGEPAAGVGTSIKRWGLAPGTSLPKPQLSARFDRSLPLTQRVQIPGGRYDYLPMSDEDRRLRTNLKRAARGWDLYELRDTFCARHSSANTRDAMKGFEAWMRSYVQHVAPGYFQPGDDDF